MVVAYFLSPALARLRAEVNALWPHRDRTSDGWIGDASHAARLSDHNPDWSSGGIVRAIDIDEDLVVGLTHVGEAMPLVEQIIRDRRVAYVIYEGRIWQNPAVYSRGGWLPYTGANAHRHHLHVSVRRGATWDRDARPWGIVRTLSGGGGSTGPGLTAPDIDPIPDLIPRRHDDMLKLITLGDTWAVTDGQTKRVLHDSRDVQLLLDLGAIEQDDLTRARNGGKAIDGQLWDRLVTVTPPAAAPQVVLTAEQVSAIVTAAREGAEDAVRGLRFVTTVTD